MIRGIRCGFIDKMDRKRWKDAWWDMGRIMLLLPDPEFPNSYGLPLSRAWSISLLSFLVMLSSAAKWDSITAKHVPRYIILLLFLLPAIVARFLPYNRYIFKNNRKVELLYWATIGLICLALWLVTELVL